MANERTIDLQIDVQDSVSVKGAEAWAVGQRNGVDVGQGDPTYHNNAKYYAEVAGDHAAGATASERAAQDAQGAAETAQGKAEAAQDAAETAQGKAETAQGKAEDAQGAAETAQGKAEDAQEAAETAQGKAEDAQGAAETAQGKAEDAQGAAETAQGKAEDAQEAAETAQGKAEDAQEAAETAQGKAEDAQGAAETAQGNAEAEALKAEGYAQGKQGGTDVGSGSPYYHANAEYYKGQAAGSATSASGSASAAAADALKAEGYAVGKQGGTDVASGSPYYHKNGKYYLEQTEAVAQSIPEDYSELSSDVSSLKSALNAEVDSTQELVGLKSGTYENNVILFFQGTMNVNTGEFSPGNTKRTTSDFLYVPIGATVSVTNKTGYGHSNIIWFDANKDFLQNGNPMPSTARYARFVVLKSDDTQAITPAEASNNTTYTVSQPLSVNGLNEDVIETNERVYPIESWFDVYDEYIIEKENITSKVANGVFGSGKNGATYSSGTLTIPANSTGGSSYIGARLTGGFSFLKNNIARIKITFEDLSGVEIEKKTLQSPNNTSLHIIDFNIDLTTNTVEYTFLLDSDTFTYLFLGIGVLPTASAQTSQKTIKYTGVTIYSSESYDNPNKRSLKMQLFGDSITDDVRVVSGSETIITTWASKITEYMTGYNLTIVNSAVGGSGIGHGKSSTARYSTKTYNYVHDLVTDGTLVTDSDVITLLIGTNNWRGEAGGSFGTLGQLGDDTVNTFYGAANLICKYIAEHSNALLVIITPPQRYNSTDQESETTALGEVLNSSGHTLKDYCKALKEVAALYGYPVVDLNDNLGWNKYNVANFTSDGLHPSALKCYRLTEVICGAIKAYLGD